jgi:lipoate-protein ligase A
VHFASIFETDPAAFLAWDEAFLDAVEAGELDSVLWFWESPSPFVVVGYGQKLEREVNVAACAACSVPALRRCSGGGAVVQGPGCLSYGVVLRMDADPALATIPGANSWIMERLRRAVSGLVREKGAEIKVRGYTDLAWGERKFSGNAQRRRRVALLFHGTFLLNFDLPLIGALLRPPSAQPDYRQDREHDAFVMNLSQPSASLEAALRTEWRAEIEVPRLPVERRDAWMRDRYARPEFHRQR